MDIAGIELDAVLVLLVTLGVVMAFARSWAPPDVVAMAAVAILLITGVLTTDSLLPVFSNSGPITVATMFVLSAALQKTGVIEWAGHYITQLASRSHALAIGVLLAGTMLLYASSSDLRFARSSASFLAASPRRPKPSLESIPWAGGRWCSR